MSIEYTPGPLLDAARNTPTALWNAPLTQTNCVSPFLRWCWCYLQPDHRLQLHYQAQGLLERSHRRDRQGKPHHHRV